MNCVVIGAGWRSSITASVSVISIVSVVFSVVTAVELSSLVVALVVGSIVSCVSVVLAVIVSLKIELCDSWFTQMLMNCKMFIRTPDWPCPIESAAICVPSGKLLAWLYKEPC